MTSETLFEASALLAVAYILRLWINHRAAVELRKARGRKMLLIAERSSLIGGER
jgi:hypothetical protein